MPARVPALILCSLLLAACGTTAQGGTILVPPPATPAAEPTPLTQSTNINHVHALATRDGGKRILVGGHHGALLAGSGKASPQPIGAATLTGDVLSLFYTPDHTLFAGGHNVGVKTSHDDGATWADASPDLKGADIHGLAQDPGRPGQLYAYAVGKGLLVSTDRGAHWTHRAGQADSNYITGLAVTADGTLLAGTPGLGVAASTDQGSSFVTIRDKTGPVYALAASASDPNVLLVAAEGGIYLTGDGGKTWNFGATDVAVTGVAIDSVDPHRFYVGAADGGVSVSADAGISFRPY